MSYQRCFKYGSGCLLAKNNISVKRPECNEKKLYVQHNMLLFNKINLFLEQYFHFCVIWPRATMIMSSCFAFSEIDTNDGKTG